MALFRARTPRISGLGLLVYEFGAPCCVPKVFVRFRDAWGLWSSRLSLCRKGVVLGVCCVITRLRGWGLGI